MDKIKKFVSSEVVNKPIQLVYCSGELERNDRIVYNYFLTIVENFFYKENNTYDRDKYYRFYTTMNEIYNKTQISHTNIKSSIKRLFEKYLVINLLEKETRVQLIGTIEIEQDNKIEIVFMNNIIELI
uniref:hypothetical protein n=1 Tax=Aliarcobacter butzleri TaxID=28197 RepID=UPI001260B75A